MSRSGRRPARLPGVTAASTELWKKLGTPPRGQCAGRWWVTTTIGTWPPGWPSQPLVISYSRRPTTTAPILDTGASAGRPWSTRGAARGTLAQLHRHLPAEVEAEQLLAAVVRVSDQAVQ